MIKYQSFVYFYYLFKYGFLQVEPQKYSVYREEAVDAITMALESSFCNETVREQCNRVLLVLGGNFSSAGKIMTEDWILKQAGFLHGPVFDSPGVEEGYELLNKNTPKVCFSRLYTL